MARRSKKLSKKETLRQKQMLELREKILSKKTTENL